MDVSNVEFAAADAQDDECNGQSDAYDVHLDAFGKAGKGGKGMTRTCWKRGGKGHQARSCPTPEDGTGKHVCYECGGKGHHGRDHEKGNGKSDGNGFKGKGFASKGSQKGGFGKGSFGKGYRGKGKGMQVGAWTGAGVQGGSGIRSISSMDGAQYATMEMPDQWVDQRDWAYGPWSPPVAGMFNMNATTRTHNGYACLSAGCNKNQEERTEHEAQSEETTPGGSLTQSRANRWSPATALRNTLRRHFQSSLLDDSPTPSGIRQESREPRGGPPEVHRASERSMGCRASPKDLRIAAQRNYKGVLFESNGVDCNGEAITWRDAHEKSQETRIAPQELWEKARQRLQDCRGQGGARGQPTPQDIHKSREENQ